MRFGWVFGLILALSLLVSGCGGGGGEAQTAFSAFGVEQTDVPAYTVAETLKDTPEALHVQIKGESWTLDQCKQVLADFIEKNRSQHAAIQARIFGNSETGEVIAYYFSDESAAAPYQAMLNNVKVREPSDGYPAFVLIHHK